MVEKIISTVRSCETPAQVDACRYWIRDLRIRQVLNESAADTLQLLADDQDLSLMGVTPPPRARRAGLYAVPAVL